METLDVMWFTPQGKTVGIVATKNDQGEVKFYLGTADGFSEEADIQKIKDWGTKVYPEMMAEFFDRNKKKQNGKDNN